MADKGCRAADILEVCGDCAHVAFTLVRESMSRHSQSAVMGATPAGHVIGDHIAFRERKDKVMLVGRASTSHWPMFAAACCTPCPAGA